jgi:protein-L-isoaspartate(D-aspartate) O-methyltransferase
MALVEFVGHLHNRTKRDYRQRVFDHDKADCAVVAKQWGYDYWDGDRQYGYGGYRYDGRWRPIADAMAKHYGLKPGQRVLDVGCGKAHLLYELTQAVPGLKVAGLDISQYGLDHAKEEVRPFLRHGEADALPFPDKSFDFVLSLATLHNLPIYKLFPAIKEIERVGKGPAKYIMVESWRNDRERVNMLYWQLTCESFFDTKGWEWLYQQCGYQGDWEYIFFS